jgi:hypothetical protein
LWTGQLGVALTQKLGGLYLYGRGRLFEGRNFGIAFAALDAAHLASLDAAPVRDLFLRQSKSLTGFPQVVAEVAHNRDRPT